MEESKLNYNPLYLQVRDVLMKRIVDGQHRPGELIPSESRLASDFGTSISTIRQALSLLVADGFLVKKQGKGTLVSDRKVRISFLSWMGETRRGEELLNGLVRKFEEKYPPIAIDIIPTTYPETRATLTRLIGSGRAPDVAQIVSHWTSYFAATGALSPSRACSAGRTSQADCRDRTCSAGPTRTRSTRPPGGCARSPSWPTATCWRRPGIGRLESPMSLTAFQECCRRISCITGPDAPAGIRAVVYARGGKRLSQHLYDPPGIQWRVRR